MPPPPPKKYYIGGKGKLWKQWNIGNYRNYVKVCCIFIKGTSRS